MKQIARRMTVLLIAFIAYFLLVCVELWVGVVYRNGFALSDEMKLYSHKNSDSVDVIVMVLESGFLCCKFRMCHCNGCNR